MKIVVLDGYTLNPGDNPWTELEALGSLTVHDRTPALKIVERAAGADIVLTNKTPLSAGALAQLPALKFISVLATGHNIVDSAAATQRGIAVANVPAYSTASVAQHTIALLLELTNHVGRHDDSVRDGDWQNCPDFCYWKSPIVELAGRTLGLVGGGRIGQAVGAVAGALGMKIWVTPSRSRPVPAGWEQKDVDEIFSGADVVSLHCPQTPETTGLVNATLLRTMRSSAYLLNTARGGLIVEADLADALRKQWLAGAAVDVASAEPIRPDNPLLQAPRCLITPHIAWSSQAARKRLMSITVENVRSFLAGAAQNRVN